MQKNNDNKSLYLYTSLIFIVAIIMIIVSFFAQTHLDSSLQREQDAEKVSLSNKAAQVSEENMQLVELNKNLRELNSELTKQVEALTGEKETLEKQIEGENVLIDAYIELYEGRKKMAAEKLQNLSTENFSEITLAFYNVLLKKAQ